MPETLAPTTTRLSSGTAFALGAGSIGTATFVVAPELLLLYYMTQLLAIPAGWAGIALLLPKMWEFLTDPLTGWLSDRTTSRWGRRRPYLLVGAIVFPLAFAALFAAPALATWQARLAFVTAAYVLSTTAYTAFAVPYIALFGEIATEPAGRTRVVAFRISFVAVGILLAGAGAPAAIGALGGDRAAYARVGVLMAGLCAVCMFAAFFAAARARIEPGVRGEGFVAGMRAVAVAKPFRALGAVYFIQMVSNGANAAMLAYAAHYLLGAGETLVGLFFAVFTLASLAATPAFAMLGRRWGKHGAFARATWIYAASMLALFAAARGGAPTLLLCGALAGIGNAGTQLYAFSLLPDVIDADRALTGVARAGVFTGVWVAGEKLGLAAGAALAGVVIDLAGFVEGGQARQPTSAVTAIAVMFSLAPAVLMAASLLFLGRDPEPA